MSETGREKRNFTGTRFGKITPVSEQAGRLSEAQGVTEKNLVLAVAVYFDQANRYSENGALCSRHRSILPCNIFQHKLAIS
jgi:hypothetical protein